MVLTLPYAKRLDGKPGLVAFFMECWTVAPIKIPLAGDWKVSEGARARETSKLPCLFAWKSPLNCCQNDLIRMLFLVVVTVFTISI